MKITVTNCKFTEGHNYSRGFEDGQKSRQAEIDKLQGRIDKTIKKLESDKPLQLTYNDAMYALMILKGKEGEN